MFLSPSLTVHKGVCINSYSDRQA